jgi:fused signal recognition particle receptor
MTDGVLGKDLFMGSENNKGFFERLKSGLAKTRRLLTANVDDLLLGEKKIDEHLFEELEATLIGADVGPAFTYEMIEKLREQLKRKELHQPDLIRKTLRDGMLEILRKNEGGASLSPDSPHTIMVIGVNGTGKTTTIGKMAHRYRREGKTVMVVAADTFRAAAIEQLEIWSRRVGAILVKQKADADPSAVVFDAVQSAKAGRAEIVIVDTAGRLHTKANLMEELKKMKRILGRELPGAPREVLLVLDATTGQNAVVQARMFKEDIGVTGIVLTKLDGTSKGGVVIRIAKELGLPIRFIGIGEGIEDLRPFNAAEFVDALFEREAA